MNTSHILNVGLRILGAATLLLGLVLWSGRFYSLVGLHTALGMLIVLGLWALALLGWRQGVPHALCVAALLWGALVLALGMSQTQLMPGAGHWLIQTLHLLVGLAALGFAAALARQMRVERAPLVRAPS
jgi:hypothetical protein